MITKIEFENYRIFRDKQSLEIKPITIVFGKNNSGKTALLKLPELLFSIYKSEDIQHFNLNNESTDSRVRIANEYRDLIYSRGSRTTSFTFYNEVGDKRNFSFHVDVDEPVIETNDTEQEEQLDTKNTIVDYIGSYRDTPGQDIRIGTTIPNRSGIKGDQMIQILLRSVKNSHEDSLFEDVSKWYRDNFEGWGIHVDISNDVYHIGMSYEGSMFTPICDCGMGISQSLPIVIRACANCDSPTLIVLEEPESHLNPSAHANLSQLIAESTKKDHNKRYLIETHSQAFVLRLQRMLAEGLLKTEDVGLYYVHFDETEKSSFLTHIEMTQDGRIPEWPKGMFEEVLPEIMAINIARK